MVESRPLENALTHVTLMQPVKVRILPTFKGVADLGLPNSYTRLIIPALFVNLFIYGWNQHLWPLLITTDKEMTTIVMGTAKMLAVMDEIPDWNITMATAIFALLSPVVMVVIMQRRFVKGLIETEK